MRIPRITTRLAGAAAAVLAISVPVAAQQITDKLSLHGYLTQGYAISDSSLTMGIPKRGTSDYRRAALLFRYDGTATDAFILQIANRRLGDSPTMSMEPDLKVDWAFYERRFGGNSFARIGKVPLPLGLSNETRYVGVTQPFYRVPFAFYSEGQYTSETLDGVVAEHRLFDETPLPITIDGYAGGYSYIEFGTIFDGQALQYQGGRARAQNVLGGQARLETPLPGLRIGGGFQRSTNTGGLYFTNGAQITAVAKTVSAEAVRDRVTLRGEWLWLRVGELYNSHQGYAQASVNLTSRLAVNLQVESGDMSVAEPDRWYDAKLTRDQALGVSYKFSPALVLKLEGHRTNGHNVEQIDNVLGPAHRGRYFITSLSAAF